MAFLVACAQLEISDSDPSPTTECSELNPFVHVPAPLCLESHRETALMRAVESESREETAQLSLSLQMRHIFAHDYHLKWSQSFLTFIHMVDLVPLSMLETNSGVWR